MEVEGKTVSGDTAIAESMNNFFCEIGKTLSDKIPQSSNPLLDNDYEVNPKSVQFHFEPITVPQIEKVLGKFDTSKGSGPDGLANFFIKIGLPVIAESLCDIFNLSLATGRGGLARVARWRSPPGPLKNVKKRALHKKNLEFICRFITIIKRQSWF